MRVSAATLCGTLRRHPFAVPAATLFAAAFAASLFFNGVRIEFFALSLFLLTLYGVAVLWRGYGRGLRLSTTPLALTLTLFWAWLAVTLLWTSVPYVSAVNFWWVGSGVLVFWLMTLVPERDHPFPGVYLVVLIAGVALALFSLYQQLSLGTHAQSTFLTRNSHAALMVLIALPASGYFLRAPGGGWTDRALGAALFILYFSIALTGSRGAMLGMFIGMAVLAAIAYRRAPRARLARFVGLVLAAFVLADFSLQGDVSGRLGTLADPVRADAGRFLIWERAWRMLWEQPWWGIGLGTYWLHWPPYRHPEDMSGGFYVHNDYLQLWIEIGLPGLLLLLAVYVAVTVTFVRLLRRVDTAPSTAIEAAALFAGLLAIAVHTFFDFDLYIHPIQLTLGLVLARLQGLGAARVAYRVWKPAHRIRRASYRTLVLLAALLPLLYFTALGSSTYLTDRARTLPAKGQWPEASRMLDFAARLMPDSDVVLLAHADVLRQALPLLPATATTEHRILYDATVSLLDRASQVNPVRAQAFYLRGVLYESHPALTGSRWQEMAEAAYAETLRLDPLAYWARLAYADVLLRQGRDREALAVLEAGFDYRYTSVRASHYLIALATLRLRRGDPEGAARVRSRIKELFGELVRIEPPREPVAK